MSDTQITVLGRAQDDTFSGEPRNVAKAMRDMPVTLTVCGLGGKEYLVTVGEYTDSWNDRHLVMTGVKKIESRKENTFKISGMTLSDDVPQGDKESLRSFMSKRSLSRRAIFHGPGLG